MRRPVARVGRPSLIGTMARTAVVAGTATAVAGHVAGNQQQRAMQAQEAAAWEQEQAMAAAQQAAAPPAAPANDTLAQLQQLADLKAQGILSDAEFEAQKARILAQ